MSFPVNFGQISIRPDQFVFQGIRSPAHGDRIHTPGHLAASGRCGGPKGRLDVSRAREGPDAYGEESRSPERAKERIGSRRFLFRPFRAPLLTHCHPGAYTPGQLLVGPGPERTPAAIQMRWSRPSSTFPQTAGEYWPDSGFPVENPSLGGVVEMIQQTYGANRFGQSEQVV